MTQESGSPGADGFELTTLSEEDPEDLAQLIQRMSSQGEDLRLRDKSASYYRWMYFNNPAGQAVVRSVRHQGQIVASFAIAPKLFQVDGERVIIGKTMDMFTDPAYQGQGLMTRCTSAVFEAAEAAGMDAWYVTPSKNSYPIFKRWGYSEDLSVIYRAHVIRWAPVLAAALKPTAAAGTAGRILDRLGRPLRRRARSLRPGWTVETIERFGPESDDLWLRVGSGYRVAIVRDARYLNWRYIDNPDQYTVLGLRLHGELQGLIVLGETVRRNVPVLEIMDIICEAGDNETFNSLIATAFRHGWENGHALVQAWSISGTSLDARIRRAGLGIRRTEVKVLTSPYPHHSGFRNAHAWLLTQGDGNDT